MVYTALQLITDSMRDVGAVAMNEPIEASEAAVGLTSLNGMIGLWGIDGLMVRATILENFPLVAGTISYTIGVGGVFAAAKPYKIMNAFVRDTYNEDTSLDIISKSEYDSLEDKIVSPGRPEALCYDPGPTQQAVQLGTIIIYPPPDMAYQLYIDQDKALTEVPAVASTITFEPAYYEALRYNLDKRLWIIYHDQGTPIRPDILQLARQSKKAIETLNSKNVVSRMDLPGIKGGMYNIYRDDYNT